MEPTITLDQLSKRHPDVENELPEGSMVVEKPPKKPSKILSLSKAIATNVLIPVGISVTLLFTAPYILASAPSWLESPTQTGSSP